jgi:hypothetical protein
MIPAAAHFIWFGTDLPWVHVLAIRSAAERGGFDRVVLHHADPLDGSPWWPELLEIDGFEARSLDPHALLTGAHPEGPALAALYGRLSQPAARANMVRAAILWSEGGVYLDLDTVTLAPLTALRSEAAVFCGVEHIVFPETVRTSLNPLKRIRALVQTIARDVLRRVPGGWRKFRAIEPWYPRAANNAVLGAEPGHPFVGALMEGMLALSPKRQMVRFALGTHMLQQTVAAYAGDDLKVCDPEVFYPLAPEISEHWFRSGDGEALGEVLTDRTRVVHWYASVRTRDVVPQIDPDYVRARAKTQLFSALALPFANGGSAHE